MGLLSNALDTLTKVTGGAPQGESRRDGPQGSERGLKRVASYKKTGTSEVGVTALKGPYTLSLVHTSSTGETDLGPLTELLRTALTRL